VNGESFAEITKDFLHFKRKKIFGDDRKKRLQKLKEDSIYEISS